MQRLLEPARILAPYGTVGAGRPARGRQHLRSLSQPLMLPIANEAGKTIGLAGVRLRTEDNPSIESPEKDGGNADIQEEHRADNLPPREEAALGRKTGV